MAFWTVVDASYDRLDVELVGGRMETVISEGEHLAACPALRSVGSTII